jgi:hypothetical protein
LESAAEESVGFGDISRRRRRGKKNTERFFGANIVIDGFVNDGLLETAVDGVDGSLLETEVDDGLLKAAVDGSLLETKVDDGLLETAVDDGLLETAVDDGLLETAVDDGLLKAAVDDGLLKAAVDGSLLETAIFSCFVEEWKDSEEGICRSVPLVCMAFRDTICVFFSENCDFM